MIYPFISLRTYSHVNQVITKILNTIKSMCVLVVINDKDGKPLRTKSCIVVIGNFEDCLYQKSQLHAPVLKYKSLCHLTDKLFGDKHILQQADFNNTFCNATLPDDDVTVTRHPIGDQAFQKDE